MKKAKIVLGLSRLSDAQLEQKANDVAAAMAENAALFPNPTPSLADFNNSVKLFVDALTAAKTRDTVKLAIKNKLRQELEVMLTNLSIYCGLMAKSDRSILAASGFTLNAENNTAKTLNAPENLTVEPSGNPGEMLLYVNPVPGAKSYLFLWTPSPANNGAWFHAMNSLPWYTIPGLAPGTTYDFKIGVAGVKGQVAYTKAISQMVI